MLKKTTTPISKLFLSFSFAYLLLNLKLVLQALLNEHLCIYLEGVTCRWEEARAVQFPSCWRGGQQAGDVADVPDMLRALCGWQVNIIQRETSLGWTLSPHTLKNHTGLLWHKQIDVLQLPGAHDTSCADTTINRRCITRFEVVCETFELLICFQFILNYSDGESHESHELPNLIHRGFNRNYTYTIYNMSFFTWNTLEELQFTAGVGLVILLHPDIEHVISCCGVMEEELQTLSSRFGVKPLTLQDCMVTRFSRGCAEVHEVAFSWGRGETAAASEVCHITVNKVKACLFCVITCEGLSKISVA